MAARTINIGGDASDANYRYKMQPLRTRIEGHGNGTKTVILNVVDVSKELRTLPEYTTKFFGVEFGAVNTFNTKRQVAIINGAHRTPDMQAALRKFVAEFILCPRCRLPELAMEVRNRDCAVRCASCGHRGSLPTTHRLKQFIIKHPPTKNRAPPPPPRKRRRRRRGNTAGGPNEPSETPVRTQPNEMQNFSPLGEGWTSPSADREQLAKRRHSDMMSLVEQSRRGARRRARRAKHTSGSKLQLLRAFVKDGHSVDDVCEEVERIACAHDLDDTKKLKLVFDAVFDLDDEAVSDFIPTITAHAELLERFTRSDKEFLLFVGCVEEILTVRQPRLATKMTVSNIFLTLYESGVFDEKQLIQWYDSPSDSSFIVTKEDAEQVRKLVQPFMTWLKTAEREEGGGDDDDVNGATDGSDEEDDGDFTIDCL